MPKITVDLSNEGFWNLVEQLKKKRVNLPVSSASELNRRLNLLIFKGYVYDIPRVSEPHIVIDNVSERSKTERSDTGNPICGSTSQTRNSEVEQEKCVFICKHCGVAEFFTQPKQEMEQEQMKCCVHCEEVLNPKEFARQKYPHCHQACHEKWDKKQINDLVDFLETYASKPLYFNPPIKLKEPKHPICPWCKKKIKDRMDLWNITYQGDTAWHKDCFFEYRHHR